MYFSYQNQGEPRVNFIYSVYHEMICSIHVLANDKHHNARLHWSEYMKTIMKKDELEFLISYYEITNHWLNMLDFIKDEINWDKDVLEFLDEIQKMKIIEFCSLLFSEIYTKEIIERALLNITLAPEVKNTDEFFFLDADKHRLAIINFLKIYYISYFEKVIKEVEHIYSRKLEHQYSITKNGSIYDYLSSLHPRIEITENRINLHKYKLFEVYKKDLDNILIFETSFIMPHLLCGFYKKDFSLTFPLYLTNYDKNFIPNDTLSIFKAIADGTRFQIIKLLYEGPKSTQILAEKLTISEAAVSKSLKLLFEAKIVSKERDGNYINYHLNLNMIDNLVYLFYEIIS